MINKDQTMSKKTISVLLTFTIMLNIATSSYANSSTQQNQLNPWVGSYCMSFFTKTRSAKVVGKDHVSISLKYQHFNWTKVRGTDNHYHDRASGQYKEREVFVFCTKYGWAEDHHIAIGIPYWLNDFDKPNSNNDSRGLANIYIFEKWNIIKETNNFPGVAIDFWYYFTTGESKRKLGDDNGAYKISAEISKAWEYFSLHFNPNYLWSEDDDAEVGEINAVLLINTNPTLWPAIEYNYTDKEGCGHSHDIVPGIIWKFKKGWSFKAGIPISIDSTFTDRDIVSIVMKLFRKW